MSLTLLSSVTLAARTAAMQALTLLLIPLKICPVAPPGAQVQADKLAGYVLWGVGILFVVGVVVVIGSIVAGYVFHMQHASKAGVVGLLVILICAVLYVIAPSIVSSILGNGCIG